MPHLTNFSNTDFRSGLNLRANGGGFIEGSTTAHFGPVDVIDPDTGSNLLDVFSSGTGMDIQIPIGASTAFSATTPGGSSNTMHIGPSSMTGIQSTADIGSPANGAQPSANTGQSITISGTGLTANTNVVFSTLSDTGEAGMTPVRINYTSPDRMVLPDGTVTSNVSLHGVSGSFPLQIVPKLIGFSNTDFRPGINLRLDGSGFAEGNITVSFSGTNVIAPDTGTNLINSFWTDTGMDVFIPANAGGVCSRCHNDRRTSNALQVGLDMLTGIVTTAHVGIPANGG